MPHTKNDESNPKPATDRTHDSDKIMEHKSGLPHHHFISTNKYTAWHCRNQPASDSIMHSALASPALIFVTPSQWSWASVPWSKWQPLPRDKIRSSLLLEVKKSYSHATWKHMQHVTIEWHPHQNCTAKTKKPHLSTACAIVTPVISRLFLWPPSIHCPSKLFTLPLLVTLHQAITHKRKRLMFQLAQKHVPLM